MLARVVEVGIKGGKKQEVAKILQNELVPVLQKQPGFVAYETLSRETDPNLTTSITSSTPGSPATASSHGGRQRAHTANGHARPESCRACAGEGGGVVGRADVARQLDQRPRVGRGAAALVVDGEHGGDGRAHAAAEQPGPVAQDGAPHEVRPGAGDQQGDVGAEPAPDHGRRAEARPARRRRRPSAPRPCSRRPCGTVERPWPVKSRAWTGPGHGAAQRRQRRRATRSPSPCSSRSGRPARAARRAGGGRGRRRCGGATPARRSSRQEVEDEVGDELGALDVHEVADVRRASRAGASAAARADVLGLRAPAHLLELEPEHAEQRHAEPGHALHRPLGPPRAEAAEAHRRVELPPPAVGVVAGADAGDVAEPLVRQAGVQPGPAPGQLVERAGLALDRRPRSRRWSSQPSSSAASIRVRSWLGTSGAGRFDGQAVEVDHVADPVGQGVGQLHHEAAALGVAEQRRRLLS